VPTAREEFAADLSARLGDQSVRQLATVSGWGRTTVADIRAGRTLPSPDQLRDLLMSVGADQAEVAQWEARRVTLAPDAGRSASTRETSDDTGTPARGDDAPAPTNTPASAASGPPGPRRAWHWLAGALAALILLATGFAGGYVVRERSLRHAATIATSATKGPASAARSQIVDIAQGSTHTCALTAGGAVWCWGRNDIGQVGDGTVRNAARPTQVTSLLADVKDIDAGGRTTCAITYASAVRCWGHNAFGQLGDGQEVHRTVPVAVKGLPGPVAKIAVGAMHVCAVMTSGDAYCWGNGQKGQLGIGSIVRAAREPVLVKGIGVQLAGITAGDDFTCAWSIRREVYCWGANAHGQLGIGTRTDAPAPVRLTAYPHGVTLLAGGAEHACAIAPAGGVDCWGRGSRGQLGTGATTDSSVPVPARGLDSGAVNLTAGRAHSCAATALGEVRCWGDGNDGQLGIGLEHSSPTPIAVPDLRSGSQGLSAADDSTCALDPEALWCWGSGRYGQIGAGEPANLARPHRLSLS